MDAKTKKAIDNILSSSNLTFGEESFIYTFTNENISSYLSYFPLSGKNVVTVTGSGDHVLNILLSVDSIHTFDINIFAYYFLILKKYAVVALELDEYLDFLSNRTSYFDQKMFKKIENVWGNEVNALEFFEYIFHLGQSGYLKKTSLFVNNKVEDEQANIARNIYLQEDNYYKLKNIILDKQILFHHSNIKDLKLEEQFDYLFMSNITDYLRNMFSGDVLRKYKKFLYAKIISLLKQHGKIISYMYDGKMEGFASSEIDDVFQYGFTQKPVGKDKILIYEKNIVRKAS